jgi:hypothetical protein
MMRAWLVIAAVLCAPAARADDGGTRVPLSEEDAELVKELALVEKLDLVTNLDLFEEDKDEAAKDPPKGQP